MKALIKHFRTNLKVNTFKTFKFADSVLQDYKFKKNQKDVYKFTLVDMIDLMRMTLVDIEESAIDELCNRFDITITNGEIDHSIALLDHLNKYNQKLNKYNNDIDFTDMIYIPATNDDIKMQQYDIVFVDESQDINKAQHLFLDKLIKPGGRIISVGDRSQAIYGFAGADVNSFEIFEKRENTITLPLSVCYRCAKSIVKNAQQINNQIESYEGQIEGEVRYGTVEEITKNDMVICRNTRPLVALYFQLLKSDKKAFIKGRDIEAGLIALYNKVKDLDKYEAKNKLKSMLSFIEDELAKKRIKKPREHPKYLNFREKMRILEIISERIQYMFEMEKQIHELFKDKVDAIELSTIHKSKGRESDRVFYVETINGERLIPSKYATQPWELEQENNILFVALSRAKKSLIYLNFTETI
jgi:superfamily I DNA/RNA helicase